MKNTVIALLIGFASVLTVSAQQKAGWRADGTGSFTESTAPTEWSKTKNVVWSTPMPGWGNASPVLVGDRLFVVAEPGTLICVNPKTGKIAWQKSNGFDQLQPKQQERKIKTHGQNGYSTPTAVSDGKSIFVLTGKGIAACYDLKGKRKWLRFVNQPQAGWGHSASPVIAGGKMIVHIANKVTALDLADGKTAWEAASKGKWGSLISFDVGGTELVITTGGVLLQAKDGKVVTENLVQLPWSSPVFVDGVLYYMDERGAGAVTFPKKLSANVKLRPSWQVKVHRDRYYSSPVVHDGVLYNVTRRGMLTALDATNGKELFKQQLKIGGGQFYPSVTLVGKELLVSVDSGTTLVLAAGRTYKEVRKNQLEKFRTCPLISGSRMYIRTMAKLYCIGKK